MSDIFESIKELVASGSVRISEHAYDELIEDDISGRDVVSGVFAGVEVEAYPDYPKGPATLILQRDGSGRPIHVVRGIPKGHDRPAVVVTSYRDEIRSCRTVRRGSRCRAHRGRNGVVAVPQP